MRTQRQATIQDLRRAIDCLPRDTRVAMLEGIRANEIIVGAYSTDSGICPMLAAHRAGGRTSCISFAKAWDRFAFAGVRRRLARRATDRELLVLTSHLEASLLAEDAPAPDLGSVIAAHERLVASRPEPEQSDARADGDPRRRPGDPDRSRELGTRSGWSWLRVVRRYDEYERALAAIESELQRRPGSDESPDTTVDARERQLVS